MKRILSVLVLALFVSGIVFAGGSSEKQELTADGKPVYVFKVAQVANATNIQKEAMNIFLDYIDENSNGQIRIERYLNGELAQSVEDTLALLSSGAIQCACDADMSLSWVAPEWISYTSVPFCFRDKDHMMAFFSSDIADEMNEKLAEQHGYRYLDNAVGARGARMLTANKKITTPADMRGLKFRVPNVIGTVASWEAMGAKVIGVPLSELFTGLQNGLVDAEENPYAQIESSGFYQVQDYIMETKHQYNALYTFINEAFWQSLPAELQQVLLDANAAAWGYYNASTDADDDRIREVCRNAGVTIVPEEEIDIDAFKALIQEKVLDSDVSKDWAEGGWEYIQSL